MNVNGPYYVYTHRAVGRSLLTTLDRTTRSVAAFTCSYRLFRITSTQHTQTYSHHRPLDTLTHSNTFGPCLSWDSICPLFPFLLLGIQLRTQTHQQYITLFTLYPRTPDRALRRTIIAVVLLDAAVNMHAFLTALLHALHVC